MDLRRLRYFVAVAHERHIGRAAARLGIAQPPLSRAMRTLEADLGVRLLVRTARGVTLTAAGEALHTEATALLAQADRIGDRVRNTAGAATLTIGTLADTAELVATRLVAAFRARHPHVEVAVHEADLGDPTAGLRAGRVDVSLTRTPFDDTGLSLQVLASERVGVVVHRDDALAARAWVAVADLDDRRWVRLPADADPAWVAYWGGPASGSAPAGGVVRTIQECLQSVLWNRTAALAPLGQPLPPGLAVVPVDDREPSLLVLAWRRGGAAPLVDSFVQAAADTFRRPRATP